MILQRQPNSWSCFVTSFAMAFDMPVDDLIGMLGHDGSEQFKSWSENPEPYNRRGFHVQEFIYLSNDLGFILTPFEPIPTSESNGKQVILPGDWQGKFVDVLNTSVGVLVGSTVRGASHAVAWAEGTIFDPAGRITTLDDFYIQCFWRVIKSKT